MSDIGASIIAAVRKKADENPDYVYDKRKCVYVADGAPACLIGHALWDMELIDGDLSNEWINGDGVEEILDFLGLNLNQEEIDWLTAVQEHQDCKRAWAQAVAIADDFDPEDIW